MAETVAELDARLEQLFKQQAFAVEHRDWRRDAELAVEIEKLKAQRARLTPAELDHA